MSVFGPPAKVTRRGFLQTAAAAIVLPAIPPAQARTAPATTLHNGIVLPSPWPPARRYLPANAVRPPYLADPPAVIGIDVGRQLFVDDFLIEASGLHREFHRASYHPASPVIAPSRDWEVDDPYARAAHTPPSPTAMVFSDGVFYDPDARLFRLWYMSGYQQVTALALSSDGLAWHRPVLDVSPGTNLVSTRRRDSTTIWLDHSAADPGARFKMSGYDLSSRTLWLQVSADGVHWHPVGTAGPCGDRSTFYRDPFRDVWVFSLRDEQAPGQDRHRRYLESPRFAETRWTRDAPVLWTAADDADPAGAELYNLDAVAYESLMLGFFTMYHGERPDREKPNDVGLGFSRDGFHWWRPSREAFLPVSDEPGSWNWSNVQSAGGGCLIVGDALHFYVSGRAGVPGTSFPGRCSTGLATLRRDGFASVTDRWPPGMPRVVTGEGPTLTTRPLRFSGAHLFVNADVSGTLLVEVLGRNGRPIAPFTREACVPVTGDGTRQAVVWRGAPSLAALSGMAVRFRFTLSDARLYAFWVSGSAAGASGGYVAAGGPGFTGERDTG